MALSENAQKWFLPSFLYSSSGLPSLKTMESAILALSSTSQMPLSATSPLKNSFSVDRSVVVPVPSELGNIVIHSPAYYAACTAGESLAVASRIWQLRHWISSNAICRGWVSTLLGYSVHGACKFGFYEFFKKYYSDIAGPEYASKYKTSQDMHQLRGIADGLSKFVKSEGVLGPYKGLVSLWGRQILYTMMKFASFKTIVEMFYKYGIRIPKDECSKTTQLGVSFAGGYVAGMYCAVVSHPADNRVSFLNNAGWATVKDAVSKLGL